MPNLFEIERDAFEVWADEVVECLTPAFYEANEEWVLDDTGTFNMWINTFYDLGYTPAKAAAVIEQAHAQIK